MTDPNTKSIPASKPTGPKTENRTCGFDHAGVCYASTCYSQLPCTTRDDNGIPKKWSPDSKYNVIVVSPSEDDTKTIQEAVDSQS